MKLPLKAVTVLSTLALLFLCQPMHGQSASKPAAAGEQQRSELEGKWEGTEVGREAKGKVTLTVSGNSIDFHGADKREWYKATFTLPAGTEPKQLHGTITESPMPEFVGKTGISIYKIEDGTLTLTGRKPGNPEAPKEFKGEADTRTFVLKKVADQKR